MFKKSFCIWISTCLVSISAFSGEYPVRKLKETHFRATSDPKIEAHIRTQLLRSAKHSIYVLTFDQRGDLEVGLPFLMELGEAAKRDVKVKFASSWGGRIVQDPLALSSSYLEYLKNDKTRFIDPDHPFEMKTNLEYLIAGGMPMLKRGWAINDGTHIKLLIVDEKYMLITGRGHGGYQNFRDSAFLFKRDFEQKENDIVADAVNFFIGNQGVWWQLKKENPKDSSEGGLVNFSISDQFASWYHYWMSPVAKLNSKDQVRNYWNQMEAHIIPIALTPKQTRVLEDLKTWIRTDRPENRLPQERPEMLEARLLFNGFMRQMSHRLTTPASHSMDERGTFIKDSILDHAILLIDRATDRARNGSPRERVRLYTFATVFCDRLKNALIRAAQSGVDVHIFTNGKEADANFVSSTMKTLTSSLMYVPIPAPIAIGWYASLGVMRDLLQAGVRIHGLKITDKYVFVHAKRLAVNNVVMQGSSNCTEASERTQEELNVRVKGQSVGRWAEEEFQKDIHKYAVELDKDAIDQEWKNTWVKQWFCKQLSFVY